MKLISFSATLLLCSFIPPSFAEHAHGIEELVVTGPLNKSVAKTALPVTVMSGEELRREVARTLGETLNSQVGITFSSFGPGVGLPVIRGQSGNRVRVLQGGVGTLDASNVSPDHGNAVEALLAERLEVIRGPATLLYGNGAIGGVVNVIDNRVPTHVPETISGAIEQRHNQVADENTTVFKLDGGHRQLAWHLDGFYRHSNNIEIEGFALDESLIEDPDDSTRGFIGNSNTRAKGATGGLSWIGEDGFIGFSINRLENNYGLPSGTHGHGHEEEEEGEEHHEDEEEVDIRIDMEQTRYDLKGEIKLDGFIKRARGHLSVTDYEHSEIERVVGEASEVGTRFNNEGVEARFTFEHQPVGGLEGVFGLQLSDSQFSAAGEEAFIPTSDIQSLAVFIVEDIEAKNWIYEFGLRGEAQNTNPSGQCKASETTWSGSISGIRQLSENANLLVSLSHSQRAATVEELFSNIQADSCSAPSDSELLVAHAATGLLEIGNPNLDIERGNNIEIALRKHLGKVRGELNLFYNEISDYIFLTESGEFVDETEIASYTQQDATFRGYEAEVTLPLSQSEQGRLELSLFSDYVRADFDRGGDVPRITPMRYGAELSYLASQWTVRFRATEVDEQDKTANNETSTDGYTLLNLYADYHFRLNKGELQVFAKGNNLLDEEIRNHTSFLKAVSPEAGRGLEFGIRLLF